MTWVPPDGPPPGPPTSPPARGASGPPVDPSSPAPAAAPPPAGPRPRRRWLTAVVGAVVLLACVVVFVLASDTGGRRGDGGTEKEEAAEIADAMEEAVAELSTFVEEERGLEFLEEVEVELLDDDAFRARLLDDLEDDADELAATTEVLQALQFLDDADDLAEILPEFLGDSVVGFYDPETGELVVRGSDLSPFVRFTLVHELTHALEDQHFELHRPELDELDDEASVGFTALVEGSAVRIEEAWVDQLDNGELRELRAEEIELGGSIDFGDVPPLVPKIISFPYAFGPGLVDALLEAGGQERLDEAFSDPPTSSAEVMEPELYLSGRRAIEVDRPAAGGEVVDEGVYGQWVLGLTLSESLASETATDIAEGWAGDRYVAWSDGGETCVRTTFLMETRAAAAELAEALGEWAADHGDAEVETDDGVTMTACG